MKKPVEKIIVGYSIVLVLAMLLLFASFFPSSNSIINYNLLISIISLLVSIVTAGALLMYVLDTNKIAEQAQKQNITNIRPFLRLQKKDGEDKLILANEGKGVAVDLHLFYKIDGKTVKLLKIPVMAAAPNSYTENFIPQRMMVDLNPEIKYFVDVEYMDIENRKYKAVFKSNSDYNDKFEIISQEEVFG